MKLSQDQATEAGFTMIEVLIGLTVFAMIVGALTAALIVTVHNSKPAIQRLDTSHDAQLIASYIVADAQQSSGSGVSTSDKTTCVPASWDSDGDGDNDLAVGDADADTYAPLNAAVRFSWLSSSLSGGVFSTTPQTVNYVWSQGRHTLLRFACSNGTLTSGLVVGSNVNAAPSIVCDASGSCTATSQTITATVAEVKDSSSGCSTWPSCQYSLSGSFRTIPLGGTAPTPPPPLPPSAVPLLTLPGGSGLTTNGNAKLKVLSGSIVVDSGAVSAKNGSITGTTSPQVVDYATVPPPGVTCTSHASYTCSPSAPVEDPYQGLPAPPPGTAQSATTCSGTLSPGNYTSAVSITSTCTLTSGVYTFQNGLAIQGNAALSSAAGGVLLYIAGGTFSVSGNGVATLTAQNTGTYSGILVFQAATDNNAMGVSGNGSVSTYNGLVYAPGAAVNAAGGGGATLLSVIALSASSSGSGSANLTVG